VLKPLHIKGFFVFGGIWKSEPDKKVQLQKAVSADIVIDGNPIN